MNHSITIGNKQVRHDGPPLVLAEIGVNHDGDPALAAPLVQIARAADAALKLSEKSANTERGPL